MASEAITTIADFNPIDSEDHYSLSDHDDYFTNDNLYYGKTGEKVVTNSLRTKYKTKDGFEVKHNKFNNEYEYSCGKGIDIKLFEGCKEKAQIEVKNWSRQPKPYGLDSVQQDILPRFSHNGGGIKLLIITFISLLTKLAVQLIEQEGIQIIEVGERLTTEFYRDLKKLYVLGSKIHKTITNFWQRKVQPKVQSHPFFAVGVKLDHYAVGVNATTPNTPINSNNSSNKQQLLKITNKQHDTLTDNYNQILKETVENSHKLWLKETERLRKLHGV